MAVVILRGSGSQTLSASRTRLPAAQRRCYPGFAAPGSGYPPVMRSLPAAACAAVALLAVSVTAAPAEHGHKSKPRLDTIALPTAFQPEGIAAGGRDTFYVGSIPTGAVYRGSFKTGKGAVLVPPQEGRAAIGLKAARGLLYVSGGPTGKAFIYNARTGANVADFQLAPAGQPTFVNDVVVTRRGAFFTDSRRAALYRVADGKASELALTGITMAEGNNLNGIVAARGGRTLLGDPGQRRRAAQDRLVPPARPRRSTSAARRSSTATACCSPGACCSWSRTGSTRSRW